MRLRRIPMAVWLALVGLTVAAMVLDPGAYGPRSTDVWVNVSLAMSYPAAGALILSHRPRHPLGLLLTAVGAGSALALGSHAYAVHAIVADAGSLPGAHFAAWLSSWVWVTGAMPALALVPALFPDGVPHGRSGRAAVALAGTAIALAALSIAFLPGPLSDFPSVPNPAGVEKAGPVFSLAQAAFFPLFVLAAVLAVASLVNRWRRASKGSLVRQQLRWFAAANAGFVIVMIVDNTGVLPRGIGWGLTLLAPALVVVSVVVSVLRYRLYDIDIVVNRALVYLVLTTTLVVTYSVGVTGLGALVGRSGGTVVTTAAVALAFDPARRRAQKAVDRLLYGNRSEPDRVLRRLTADVAAAKTPASALQMIAEATIAALGCAGVTITIERAGRTVAEATAGVAAKDGEVLPLEHGGRVVGKMAIVWRTDKTRRRRDHLTIGLVRLQAGLAGGAALLAEDLQRSRLEAVVAREEERRRIRRDLHDGLGPRLAGLALGLESAHDLATQDPPAAADILGSLTGEAYGTIADMRALVHGLRPDMVDQLGLVPALRERLLALAPGGRPVRIALDAPPRLGALPAAVEVAAFRITLEAVSNVVRHSEATQCTVSITVDDHLTIVVEDDGRGFDPQAQPSGLGLPSMTERAVELGGSLSIEPVLPSGTRLRARLPIAVAP